MKKQISQNKFAARDKWVQKKNDDFVEWSNHILKDDGQVIVNKYIKRLVDIYMYDRMDREDLIYRQDEVDRFIGFCFWIQTFHDKKSTSLSQYNILPWHSLFIRMCFGFWRKEPYTRKYVEVFLFIARQNGKTSFCALIALYMMVMDNEINPGGFLLAYNHEQAKTALKFLKDYVNNSPMLQPYLRSMQYSIRYKSKDGKSNGDIRIMTNDAEGLDSHRPNVALFDETHTYPDDSSLNKITTGMNSRNRPLKISMSTADQNTINLCYQQFEYSKKVLENPSMDDYFLPILFTLDDPDDILDNKNWVKSNPSIGYSITKDALVRDYDRSREIPSKYRSFLADNLNIFVEEEGEWIPSEKLLPVFKTFDMKKLEGKNIFIGVDASNNHDMSAVSVLCYDDEEDHFYSWTRFWLPNNKESWSKRQAFKLQLMEDRGFLERMEDELIDFKVIYKYIDDLNDKFNIMMVNYDNVHSMELSKHLDEHIIPHESSPRKAQYTHYPISFLERLIYSKKITIYDNECMMWNFQNVLIRPMDANNNLKYDKNKSKDSIDGLVALIGATYSYVVKFIDPTLSYIKNEIADLNNRQLNK